MLAQRGHAGMCDGGAEGGDLGQRDWWDLAFCSGSPVGSGTDVPVDELCLVLVSRKVAMSFFGNESI